MKWLPQSGRLLLKHFYCECSNSWFILSNRVFELNAKIYWSCSGSMWWPNNLMRQLTLCSLWISQEPASEHFPSTFGIFIDSPVFFFCSVLFTSSFPTCLFIVILFCLFTTRSTIFFVSFSASLSMIFVLSWLVPAMRSYLASTH